MGKPSVFVALPPRLYGLFFSPEVEDLLHSFAEVLRNEVECDLNEEEMSERVQEVDGAILGWEGGGLTSGGGTMSAGQFRHGPLEAVSLEFAAVVFAMQGRTRDINLRLAHDIAEFGGKVVIIGGGEELQGERIFNLTLPPLDEFCSPCWRLCPSSCYPGGLPQRRGCNRASLIRLRR